MKIITELQEANSVLQSYKGGKASVWLYSVSLKRLAVRVSLPNINYITYIIGVSCDQICGPFSWDNANIVIEVESYFDKEGPITKIYDNFAGFILSASGGFSLAQGLDSEFGESFDNFILTK